MGIKAKQRVGTSFKILFGLIWILPIFLALIFSFYPNISFMKIPLSVTTDTVTIENYIYIFQNVPIIRYLTNTMIMILICIPCQVILSSSAAYSKFAGQICYADTPGAGASNLKRFQWNKLPKNIYPFGLSDNYQLEKAKVY